MSDLEDDEGSVAAPPNNALQRLLHTCEHTPVVLSARQGRACLQVVTSLARGETTHLLQEAVSEGPAPSPA